MQNEQLDKCVLYAFRCAVAYARDPEPNPNEYRWWHFTDEIIKGKWQKSLKTWRFQGFYLLPGRIRR